MQAIPSLDFIPPKPRELAVFAQMLQKAWRNLTTLINNKIGFGDGTNRDNLDGVWANVVAPVAPNTDFTITHNLGRVPVGYWALQKDRACDLYTGSVAATSTQLTLRATVASAVLRLFIIGLLLSLLPLQNFAQGANHTNIAFKAVTPSGSGGVSGTVTQPISGATISVCNGSTLPAAGSTCSPVNASLFSCVSLVACALTNPTSADANGNYSFYATAQQNYVISVSGVGLTTYSYVWTAPIASGSTNASLTTPTLTTPTITNPTTTGTDSGVETLNSKTLNSPTLVTPSGIGPRFQQFTSSGTFTIPTGVTVVKVSVVGGGGAGGGSTAANVGAGGGGGGTGIKWLSGLTPGNTLTVIVGLGGTGVSGAAGNNGATSSVSSGTQSITTITTNGGTGGGSGATIPGPSGGAQGSGGDINLAGGYGLGAPFVGASGSGGASSQGVGAVEVSVQPGNNAVNPGSGGSGAFSGATGVGGNGANGIVIFEWVQ